MQLKSIEMPETSELGQPEEGAPIFDAATGAVVGTVQGVSERGSWRLPRGIEPGRYRVMLPFEFDIPDFSELPELPPVGKFVRAK